MEGEDFILGATELVFPSGTIEGGMECVAVNIVNDNVLEFEHTFTFSLLLPSSPPGASLAATSPDNTEYTIMDDEGMYIYLIHSFEHRLKSNVMIRHILYYILLTIFLPEYSLRVNINPYE